MNVASEYPLQLALCIWFGVMILAKCLIVSLTERHKKEVIAGGLSLRLNNGELGNPYPLQLALVN